MHFSTRYGVNWNIKNMNIEYYEAIIFKIRNEILNKIINNYGGNRSKLEISETKLLENMKN